MLLLVAGCWFGVRRLELSGLRVSDSLDSAAFTRAASVHGAAP